MSEGIRIMGESVVWGAKPEFFTVPIINLPPGATKVRRRFRMRAPGEAFVKEGDSVQRWRLSHVPGGMKLCHMLGANCGGAS